MKASKNQVLKNWVRMVDYMDGHAETEVEKLVHQIATDYNKSKAGTYMVTQRAEDLITKINVKKVDLQIYKQVPNGIYGICLMSNPNSMIILEKESDELATAIVLTIKDDALVGISLKYTSIRIDIKRNVLRSPTKDLDEYQTKKGEEFVNNELKQFIAYIFLSDIELKVLPINGKYGTASDSNRLKNDSHTPLTLVTDKWNTITLRVGDFGVSGHFGWRRCGVGRLDRRLVYIDSYMKHSYKRRG
jgi:hypothetical protein